MEKTDEKLASLIERLQEAGFAQAPEIIDGAIRAIYWDGAAQLGFFGLLSTIFLGSVFTFLHGLFDTDHHLGENKVVAGSIGGIISLIGVLITGLADNPWLRVFDPEAYLYQQIVNGLLGV